VSTDPWPGEEGHVPIRLRRCRLDDFENIQPQLTARIGKLIDQCYVYGTKAVFQQLGHFR
jgi:hypothetical protein